MPAVSGFSFLAFAALPPEEQKRRLIEHGTINEHGEVLMGLDEAKEQEIQEQQQAAPQNGAPPAAPVEGTSTGA